MAKFRIRAGDQTPIVYVFIQDSSATDGSGLSGLTGTGSGITASYVRRGEASNTFSLVNLVSEGQAYGSGSFGELTNLPGVYRLDLPTGLVDAGASSVTVMLRGATNMAPVLLELQLDDMSEPSAGSIPANEDIPLEEKINWCFKVLLGRLDSNGTNEIIRNRANTTDLATNTISDGGGVTIRGQFS